MKGTVFSPLFRTAKRPLETRGTLLQPPASLYPQSIHHQEEIDANRPEFSSVRGIAQFYSHLAQ
jgi:hypothetical protein